MNAARGLIMAGRPDIEPRNARVLNVDESDHVARLEMLLMQAEEAINLVRRLLRDVIKDEMGSGCIPRPRSAAPAEMLPFVRTEKFRQIAGAVDLGAEAADARNWEFVTRALVRDRFGSVGHVGAGVLVRLLCAPGDFVSGDDLARAAGVRSSSSRVVKVYICRLRTALSEIGLSPTSIETGRRSYRLHEDAATAILTSLRDYTGRSRN